MALWGRNIKTNKRFSKIPGAKLPPGPGFPLGKPWFFSWPGFPPRALPKVFAGGFLRLAEILPRAPEKSW